MGRAGGKDLKETVRRIMERVMSVEMARKHNWAGQNRQKPSDDNPDVINKIGLSSSPLVPVIKRKFLRKNQPIFIHFDI